MFKKALILSAAVGAGNLRAAEAIENIQTGAAEDKPRLEKTKKMFAIRAF